MPNKDLMQQILQRQDAISKQLSEIAADQKTLLREILKQENEIINEEGIIKREEDRIEAEEEEIKHMETKITELINSKVAHRRFSDIIDWKEYIWQKCEFKESQDNEKELTYFCKKLNKPCNFNKCPLNFE